MLGLRFIFLTLTFLLITACGPVYRTFHEYQPPNSPDARYCVNSCDSILQNCKSRCDDREQNCEMSANAMDAISSANCIRSGSQNCPTYYQTTHYHCKNHQCKSECVENYNRCYQNCGGNVITRTSCVYGCNQ